MVICVNLHRCDEIWKVYHYLNGTKMRLWAPNRDFFIRSCLRLCYWKNVRSWPCKSLCPRGEGGGVADGWGVEADLLQCPIEIKRNPFGGLPRRDKKSSRFSQWHILKLAVTKNYRKQSTRLAGKATDEGGRSGFIYCSVGFAVNRNYFAVKCLWRFLCLCVAGIALPRLKL